MSKILREVAARIPCLPSLGKGEEKIRFDVFSETSQTYVESCYAFASTAVAAELHRQHGYRVLFNDKPNYPKILEILEEVPLPKTSVASTSKL